MAWQKDRACQNLQAQHLASESQVSFQSSNSAPAWWFDTSMRPSEHTLRCSDQQQHAVCPCTCSSLQHLLGATASTWHCRNTAAVTTTYGECSYGYQAIQVVMLAVCMQAKQEEEQQKTQEEAKRRQEAMRKREEEAAQRR